LKFHDFIEAIITDFTPYDKISREEKHRLEILALNLLTESRTQGDLVALHIYNCVLIYEGLITNFDFTRNHMLDQIKFQKTQGNIRSFQIRTEEFFDDLYRHNSPENAVNIAVQAQDIDKVHMAVRVTRFSRHNHSRLPRGVVETKAEDFWSYIDRGLTIPKVRDFFESLRAVYQQAPEMDFRSSLSKRFKPQAIGSIPIQSRLPEGHGQRNTHQQRCFKAHRREQDNCKSCCRRRHHRSQRHRTQIHT